MIQIQGTKNSVTVYTDYLEQEAYNQLKTLASQECYADCKMVVMPDVHAGKGCTIGTTMTIKDRIAPNLIGVDIGCGMLVWKLGNIEINLEILDSAIRRNIPHGFGIHAKSKVSMDFSKLKIPSKHVNLNRALLSIGTLGGGNHFIEIAEDDENNKYLIIHSGSRHFGNQICKYYQDLAWSKLNECSTAKQELIDKLKKDGKKSKISEEVKKFQKVGIPKELAYLEGQDFHDYMNDMEIAQKYAEINRFTMAKLIISAMNWHPKLWDYFQTIHNYIGYDNILRKGAVSAEEGEKLLIPMNMRDGSLLCVGKGNPDWNYSAPHGAGRILSRGKAKEQLSLEEFKETMKGVYTTCVGRSTLDESPMAYKPMEEIINKIGDTVDVLKILKPIYNFKSE